ncbi:MAG: sialidase family protein [Planctomycetota bacterium]|nr:sialidase family protein [Planctomycetota bacterium]
MMRNARLLAAACGCRLLGPLTLLAADPPGVIIDRSPDPTRVYIGSPSIAVMPGGDYVASHDFFGPGTTNNRTAVFGSRDRGKSWQPLVTIEGQWWSTLFVHYGALYIIGTSKEYGFTVIRRSSDGGKTWTEPKDGESGLLLGDGKYHCAPVPLVVHNGRIWRAMEDAMGPGGWGSHFRAMVLSAPADADLLKAASWTFSNRLRFDPAWLKAKNPGWLEGNAVVTPEGGIVDILRLNDDRGDRACIARVSDDGKTLSFDPEKDIIDMPGGRTKFTIRFDPETKRYWSLVNKQLDPPAFRNILALVSSADLRTWRVESILLRHEDTKNHAFQYVDWLFEWDDIIAVSRTAWDGSFRAHDANYLTFHRVSNFRKRTLQDPPLN